MRSRRDLVQVVAEASLLGVPVVSVVGKANADLILPSHLLLPRQPPPTATQTVRYSRRRRQRPRARLPISRQVAFVNATLWRYERSAVDYARLSEHVRNHATARLRPPDPRALLRAASACCAADQAPGPSDG